MNFGRAVGLFNRFSPKISKGIGQVANIARNIGQAVQNVRNIGSTVNEISGGRLGSTPFGRKVQEITNKVESGANFIFIKPVPVKALVAKMVFDLNAARNEKLNV